MSKQNIKRNFKCNVLSVTDSNSQGEFSCLFYCWEGGDPKWKLKRAPEKAKLFLGFGNQSGSIRMRMYWNFPSSSDFCGHWTKRQRLWRGGSQARRSHVAFGMGTQAFTATSQAPSFSNLWQKQCYFHAALILFGQFHRQQLQQPQA